MKTTGAGVDGLTRVERWVNVYTPVWRTIEGKVRRRGNVKKKNRFGERLCAKVKKRQKG